MNIMKSIFHLCCIAALSVFVTCSSIQATPSQPEYPEDVASRLEQKYTSLTSLSFNFRQESRGQLAGRPKTGNGTAYFHKSGDISRMRWNYNEPDRQVLVSDGKTFSMYFESLHQMIVTPASQLDTDLTYSVFRGKDRISEKFHILPPEPRYAQAPSDTAAPSVIKLVPVEEHGQIQDIHLWVDEHSLIRRIEIKDHFGTITLINLSDIRENELTEASDATLDELFLFTPPENTEIITQ